jgi:hypothetical protein
MCEHRSLALISPVFLLCEAHEDPLKIGKYTWSIAVEPVLVVDAGEL